MKNTLKDLTILVAEDDVELAQLLIENLMFFGAKVHAAKDGAMGLELLKAHKVDVIISDVRMPGMDGIDFLKHVRAANANHPPFLFLTGFADISPREAAKLGAQGMLNKPIHPPSLAQAITNIIFAVERSRAS